MARNRSTAETSLSYRDAGVDLDASEALHTLASRLLAGRREAYTSSVELAGLELILHVDGVGTKTLVLEKLGRLRVAGWDCVVMNTNDVACDAARPLALVDYIAMPRADEAIFREILEGIREAAAATGAVLLGGETAILPGLAQGVDVVCTILAVREPGWRGNRARPGDVLVGLESSGLHANGYSLARRIIEERLGGYTAEIEGLDLAEELSKPVKDYTGFLLEAWSQGLVIAAAHITGGAFTKMKRILPSGATAVMKMPKPPRIFQVLMEAGNVEPSEAYRVWNMGIGLVVAAPRESVDELLDLAEKHGHKPHVLGLIEQGRDGARILLDTPYGKVAYS
ncbi:Phosphoribosylformylglycinamidine cyclo-ligase [Pyrodictium delaneyi]|uniref:phosphoribosylformylglycinamidine cyclo-ligase n=1 Tax=Pyrodictium delaneyi TaxID=1273541 RepID=A0A0P0N451_9CREN|nr:phosphoribosylformylglycinamidine cyclo-ligase [Pyrodictium delaneyi]ALL01470.1 Phosphoribosylformylglycinamidine cyclo-ligase [Pyrodictium delaneyi]OWJ54615.1 phosphoribosylformylglycinamidine cyclo-ligase [Pyrodictium delaneyi]